ncbi:GntR family transcriptional regulator [Psychrosphaera sp. B3R10]|uniref:GntR family transcriptional regulator n=1 Tax=unclassified Psychrosphaera TaxID=2641570 RepID=UPI001C0A0DB9|nr:MULTISPECIES: GntR family transcriptional regulator [unclassified Psychrosphaera]MBU2880712.1 GntR family transcriptional regulator [Psychrosphaera sp. I2R16]MBU2991542.1 GntR family transcriptional regulator [Psychrosphaera sp. B3R10]MDO6719434.1 GntR family transcriptional regulator [Psychrosphaera sp. 1_MG-2023]
MAGVRAPKILSVKDQIAEQIRSDIIAGDLAPNTKLNEKELAERFGLSRGPIRDVILQLTKEGLLISKNNCGASVNSILDPKLQKLMIKLRREIEVFAIEQLKDKLTANDVADLESILDELQEAFERNDYTEVTKIDISFHNYLIHKAGGDELVNIWYPYVMRMRLNYKRITTGEECVNEHRVILDALKDGDISAATKAIKANIK